jgi:hypothetical protein
MKSGFAQRNVFLLRKFVLEEQLLLQQTHLPSGSFAWPLGHAALSRRSAGIRESATGELLRCASCTDLGRGAPER